MTLAWCKLLDHRRAIKSITSALCHRQHPNVTYCITQISPPKVDQAQICLTCNIMPSSNWLTIQFSQQPGRASNSYYCYSTQERIVAERLHRVQSEQRSENSLAPSPPPHPYSFHPAQQQDEDLTHVIRKFIQTVCPPGCFFRHSVLPEWYFIRDRNNSFTHLCANRQHFSNQIGVVLTQNASDPNLLQFSAWWQEQQQQVGPSSAAVLPSGCSLAGLGHITSFITRPAATEQWAHCQHPNGTPWLPCPQSLKGIGLSEPSQNRFLSSPRRACT